MTEFFSGIEIKGDFCLNNVNPQSLGEASLQ